MLKMLATEKIPTGNAELIAANRELKWTLIRSSNNFRKKYPPAVSLLAAPRHCREFIWGFEMKRIIFTLLILSSLLLHVGCQSGPFSGFAGGMGNRADARAGNQQYGAYQQPLPSRQQLVNANQGSTTRLVGYGSGTHSSGSLGSAQPCRT